MTEHQFSLIPFSAPALPAISLEGSISLQAHALHVQYLLEGQVEQVRFPPPSSKPGRKDELWKGTCFEFFLSVKDEPGYWEFNMSPSGDWNVYHMEGYRRIAFREETGVSRLPFEFSSEPDRCSLDVAVDLRPLVRPDQELQLGITAIIQTKDGRETYWALAHATDRADFHRRESFILELGGARTDLRDEPARHG